MKEIKENRLVVKHNKLIEFKGRMTTNELKLFSLIIADVREQQEEVFEQYEIDLSILKETSEHKDFYNYIKEIAFRLEDKRIEVESINEKGKRESYPIRLINRPRIVEDSKFLELYIVKDLIPYIIDLKREFTRYEIENILRLKSSYAVRIYELLKQYESIGKREIDIKELRDYLGIEKQEYTRFDNFEARVLAPAKNEINGEIDKEGNVIDSGTDILINYDKLKVGRRITSILFKIESKDQDRKEYINYLNETYNIKDMQFKMGLKNEQLSSEQVIKIYERAIEKIADAEMSIFEYIRLNYLYSKEKKSTRNVYSYLMKALDNDYASAMSQISLEHYL